MFLQQVLSVVIARVAEHGMNVVAVAPFAAGASVVVFDQDRRTMHAIINRAPGIDGSHPREMDLADACIVRMTELGRDSQVITVDRDDFAAYRRNGRDFIPVIVPPAHMR